VTVSAYSVTLADLIPPQRGDGVPWTQVEVQESPAEAGPWNAIDTQALSPLDADPEDPQRRTVTTDLATLADGWYRVRWLDQAGATTQTSDPVTRPAEWVPTPDDVAALVRTRIRRPGGSAPTSFTDDTLPTEADVLSMISMQASLVMIDVGDLSDSSLICAQADDVRSAVRTLITQRTAAAIELAYWPDSVVNSGPAAADYWTQLVDVDQPKVVAAARECRLGEVEPGEEQEAATSPSYQFDVYGGETFADRFVKPMNRRW
jgi:hypothetical protein